MPPSVAILCGGRGTRLVSDVPDIPKPLVEIGGRPILWHVIQIYAHQGLRRFVLATGHKREMIEAFVAETEWPAGVEVHCVATGEDTPTGGRIHQLRTEVDGTFMATYADGVADIDLDALAEHHRRHGRAATMTVVRPELQFGVAVIDDDGDRVSGFQEKPRAEQWINGGFFVFEPTIFDYLDKTSVLEREPLERLAEGGELHAFRHTGFWECMDTYKDATQLNDLWAGGSAPWKIWQ